MALIEITREVDVAPVTAWARLTDWQRHGEFVPLTRITATPDGFVARTGFGRLAFDDPMRIEEWDPPRHARLVKTGRVVRGWADLSVEATTSGSRVVWREELHVTGVPRFAAGVERRASSLLFGRVIDRLLAG